MRLAMRNRAFLFFSLIMPLSFLFIYAGIFGRGNRQAMPYLLAEVLALTVMGSFWGLSVQLVTFREQGILRRFRVAPISASAMLASSIISNYFLTIPTVIIEFYLSRQVFHMSSMGNLLGVFVLITLGIATFATLGLVIASRSESFVFPAGNLPGQRLATIHGRSCRHFGAWFGLGLYARLYRDCFPGFRATLSLGTGGQSAAPRQALGRCRGDPFPLAWRLGKQARPCAHPRSDGFSVHGAFVSPGNASTLTRERFYESM